MKKRTWLSLVLVLVLGISSITAVLAEETIKIGGIGVLSGPYAVYGLAVQKGINLYVKELNAKGGIDGKQVEVIWEDSRGEPSDGVLSYEKLVSNDGVVAILGPVLTGVTKAVAEYAADEGIPLITPSATAYEVTTDRPNVFRTCFLDPFQAVQMARYCKDEGLTKVAVLYDNGTEYSKGLYEAFMSECEVLGLQVVASEAAAYGDVDFKTQLTNVKNAQPEAVFLPYYGPEAALILTQANDIGLEVRFLGADGISNIVDSILNKALLTNMTYSDHFSTQSDNPLVKGFVEALLPNVSRRILSSTTCSIDLYNS